MIKSLDLWSLKILHYVFDLSIKMSKGVEYLENISGVFRNFFNESIIRQISGKILLIDLQKTFNSTS